MIKPSRKVFEVGIEFLDHHALWQIKTDIRACESTIKFLNTTPGYLKDLPKKPLCSLNADELKKAKSDLEYYKGRKEIFESLIKFLEAQLR